MKKECDNNCTTCELATKIHCTLVYVKNTNNALSSFDNRIEILEKTLSTLMNTQLIDPMKKEE